VTAARASDRRLEFTRLAEGLEGPLHAAALRLTREASTAADLVQETWYRAFRSFDQFQPGTSFKAWVFRIQMNAFLNAERRRKKEPRLTDFETDEPQERPPSADEDASAEGLDVLFDRHVSDEVKRALDRLPVEFRSVLVPIAIGGLSYEETARAVGIPVGTVMSRLFRARRALRADLAAYARENGFLKRAAADGPAGGSS
jgi:RNA polymerase sigma-70 factor (ECF subfamily)